MTREESIKWAAEIAAFQAGKRVQYRRVRQKLVTDWEDITCAMSFSPGVEYRIKPELKRVPLGLEDVPPGSVVRNTPGTWCSVAYVGMGRIVLASAPERRDWTGPQQLMDEDWEISRDGGKTWVPCWKEVAE